MFGQFHRFLNAFSRHKNHTIVWGRLENIRRALQFSAVELFIPEKLYFKGISIFEILQ
jgi:hypothetical protein